MITEHHAGGVSIGFVGLGVEMGLQVQLQHVAGQPALLVLNGVLDDSADFAAVILELKSKKLAALNVDLEGVSRTNSVGIREWLIFLEQVTPRVAFTFQKMSNAFIEQANLVPNLLGPQPVRIQSLQIPEICPKCEALSKRVLQLVAFHLDGGRWKYPTAQCSKCNVPLELDGIESEYFRILKRGAGV